MSFSYLLSLIAASYALIGAGWAAPAHNITRQQPINPTNFYKGSNEVLAVPLKRVGQKGVGTPSLAKRYFSSDVLGVYGAAYFAELTLGTAEKPQKVNVLIDTGSFELWVNPDCNTTNVKQYCQSFGHYDPGLSSTSQNLHTNFKIQYGLGSASGVYHKDDVYISGAKIQNQQFGVSDNSSDVWFGILGLGHGQGHGVIQYSSIVDSLAAQGYTNSKLFSLDLGGQPGPTAAVTGEMVFGGVDTNKYSGYLAKVPTNPSDAHYVVTLNSISHQTPTNNTSAGSSSGSVVTVQSEPILDSSLPLQVVMDSGTTLSLLPEPVVSALAAKFPGATPDGHGGYKVPCSLRDTEGGSLSFGFAGAAGSPPVTITVAYKDFIWWGGDDCFLGAWYTKDVGVWILGDTFLRGAYVSFDQSNNALYMADYTQCGEGSKLVPVPAGPDAAAHIKGSCQPPAVQRMPQGTITTTCTDDLATPTPMPPPPKPTPAKKPANPAPFDEDCDEDEPPQRPVQVTRTATETFTSTIIRHIVYTAQHEEITRHEVFVTTFCPGDIIPPPSPAPAPARPRPGPQIQIHPTPAAPTTTTAVEVTQVQATATATATATETLVTTERYETITRPVASCVPGSGEACDAMTTEVVTIVSTVRVHAYPSFTPSSRPLPPAPISAYAGGTMMWGFNNHSSSMYPVAGVANIGGGASRVGAVAAPVVPTTRGSADKTPTQTKIPVPTSGATERRRVKIGRTGVWGMMIAVMWAVVI
ncbi:acid protease [Hypomontagnella monticulosa]|nr:acid protease [Hypomontagnella monticulosa]